MSGVVSGDVAEERSIMEPSSDDGGESGYMSMGTSGEDMDKSLAMVE